MKKVLQSFLSRVTSRISFVMLTSLPATGGTRRKSRILWDGDTSRTIKSLSSEHSRDVNQKGLEKWHKWDISVCTVTANNINHSCRGRRQGVCFLRVNWWQFVEKKKSHKIFNNILDSQEQKLKVCHKKRKKKKRTERQGTNVKRERMHFCKK